MDFTLLYPGFKKRALTFSYDDGVRQDMELIPLLKKYGFKGTFNLNSGLCGVEKERIDINGRDIDCSRLALDKDQKLYEGMEIASHALTHPFLETLPLSEQEKEIGEDKKNLERIFRQKVIGFAYPFGTYNLDTFKALDDNGIKYARTVKSTYGFLRPNNWLLWHPTIHHNDPKVFKVFEDFLNTNQELALCYIWGHAYEFAMQHNFDIIDKLGNSALGHEDIWDATNGEIYTYLTGAETVYYKKREEGFLVNPSNVDVYLEDQFKKQLIIHPKERIKYE